MIEYKNYRLLLTEHNIHECVDRLLHEFMLKNITLELSEAQDIFSRTLGFTSWENFYTIVQKELELIKFSINYLSLTPVQQQNLISNFIDLSDANNLKKFIHFKFEPGHSYSGNQNALVQLLDKTKHKNAQFQEDIFSYVKDYVVLKEDNYNELISVIVSANISHSLFDEFINKYRFDKQQLQSCLVVACENNKISLIKHLLLNYPTVNIDDFFCVGFSTFVFNPLCCAVRFNHIDAIKILLTSPELKQNANINISDSEALFISCSQDNLNLVRYLLLSDELKVKADMYAQNCRCLLKAFDKNCGQVVQFLLYDMQIKVSPTFYENTSNKNDYTLFNDKNKLKELTHMIEKRDLYFSLNNKLSKKDHHLSNRVKI